MSAGHPRACVRACVRARTLHSYSYQGVCCICVRRPSANGEMEGRKGEGEGEDKRSCVTTMSTITVLNIISAKKISANKNHCNTSIIYAKI